MAGIVVRDLEKTFLRRDGSALPVLRHVNLEARDREFICLLGPSGCGKSTTLNVLVGLVDPDGGEITVDGVRSYRKARYGYVFQRPRLLNWKTVRDNLAFALECCGIPGNGWSGRIDRYLRLVGLESFADEYPHALSGGMQQRVAIARALAVEPDILLMDEPFSSLDELTARRLRTELLRIWSEESKTVLFVTHNALEAVYLADRIYLMTDRPASVFRKITVDVPRPRDSEDPRLLALYKDIVVSLVGE